MNTQSALSFVPHLLFSLACTCVGQVSAAETNFSASIVVHLARESFLETEEIRGKIHLKVSPGKSADVGVGQAEPEVAPTLDLVFDSQLAAVPLEVAMNRSLDKSVMTGGEVEIPFEIRTWPEFSQRLRSLEGIARLRRGRHHCYAVLQRFAGYGPVLGWNMRREMNWFTTIGATQHFEIIASGARSVSSEELIQAAREGPDSFKMTFATFFGDHGQLAPGDLLPILGSAGPETKGRLAGLFQKRGGELEGLTPFFERPKDRVLLDNHTNAPFFLKVAPGEALRFVYDTTVFHNANGLDRNYGVLGKLEKNAHAPKQPGVYRVGCDVHSSTWAWVLVTDSNK